MISAGTHNHESPIYIVHDVNLLIILVNIVQCVDKMASDISLVSHLASNGVAKNPVQGMILL